MNKRNYVHTSYIFSILLISGLFYIFWRLFFTLNLLTSPFTTFWSYTLLFAEFITLLIFTNFSLLILKSKKIIKKDKKAKDINFNPSVDIFICTYNEPLDILTPTVLGAYNITYENKKIYVLDDGKRDDVKKMCEIVGVNYITRKNNIGFKAGNINHALSLTQSDLIVIFDSDHVPFSNFLNETVDFFKNDNLALVQTPQFFGNLDAIQKNLEIPKLLSNEQDMFYKIIEPALNDFGAVFCGGTNIILRRKHLKAVNNFPQTTITEDSLLGLIFHSQQFDVLYYEKPLAVGIAASTFDEYITQRKRWAKGNLQIIKNVDNWKYYTKLKPMQAFFYLTSTLYFLTPVVRLVLLLTPVFFLIFDVSTVLVVFYQIFLFQIVYFTVKYMYLFNDKIKSANIILADVYDVITSIFTIPTILTTLFIPKKFQKIKFQVTDKMHDKIGKNFGYKFTLFAILTILIAAETQGIIDLLYNEVYSVAAVIVNLFWNTINIITIAVSFKAVCEKPEKRDYIRIDSDKKIVLEDCYDNKYNVEIEDISRSGIRFLSEMPIKNTNMCKLKTNLQDEQIIINILRKSKRGYQGFFENPISIVAPSKEKINLLKKFIKFAYKKN